MKLFFRNFDRLSKRMLSYVVAQNGATAIEYAMIAAAIALGIVAIVFTIGGSTQQSFTDINAQLAP